MISTERKYPIWTNSPEWQNQDTGETTEEGRKHLKSKNQLSLMEENMSKFAKKSDTAAEAKITKAAPAKKVAANKSEKKAAPAKKADKAEKGPDTRKITVLTKENPKREGSKAYKTFGLYAKAKTVEDFIKAGGSTADLRFDEKAGHIKVA